MDKVITILCIAVAIVIVISAISDMSKSKKRKTTSDKLVDMFEQAEDKKQRVLIVKLAESMAKMPNKN